VNKNTFSSRKRRGGVILQRGGNQSLKERRERGTNAPTTIDSRGYPNQFIPNCRGGVVSLRQRGRVGNRGKEGGEKEAMRISMEGGHFLLCRL